MNEFIVIRPLSHIVPQKQKFAPRWFGAGDYNTYRWMKATPRLSPAQFLKGRDTRGKLWISTHQ